MNTPTKDDLWSLTEREKQTLRLIVRGHDAKSTARSLGLSVHTINERLRDARRKMAVSSSREAARLLLDAERGDPTAPHRELLGDKSLGEDAACPPMDQGATPIRGVGSADRRLWIIIGVLLMTFALGLLALVTLSSPGSVSSPVPAASTTDPAALDSARQWLALLDQRRWDDSYRATGKAFRKLNTSRTWAAVSEKVRAPLGAVTTRTFLSEEQVPAPPSGYEVVKFRTRFANKPDAVETVTLDHESENWRVVGVTID